MTISLKICFCVFKYDFSYIFVVFDYFIFFLVDNNNLANDYYIGFLCFNDLQKLFKAEKGAKPVAVADALFVIKRLKRPRKTF